MLPISKVLESLRRACLDTHVLLKEFVYGSTAGRLDDWLTCRSRQGEDVKAEPVHGIADGVQLLEKARVASHLLHHAADAHADLDTSAKEFE